ncbi:hypothetical protein, partial [Cylindrospermopsis raciborskii]|uniref:hypothetical protein n=1 Tax=Cylindrospermopsis raciborskii TaxID=77022 RepID=UPI0022CAD6EF
LFFSAFNHVPSSTSLLLIISDRFFVTSLHKHFSLLREKTFQRPLLSFLRVCIKKLMSEITTDSTVFCAFH